MPAIPIDSLDDPRLAPYRELRNAAASGRRGLFVAEGFWLAERLLASRYRVHSLLAEQRRVEQLLPRLPADAPLFVIPDKAAPELVGFDFHRGVLACGHRGAPLTLDQLPMSGAEATLVVCCGVRDPENLGVMVRNCAALGADGLLLDEACADPLSRRVLRVSMGSSLMVPHVLTDRLAGDLQRLEARGFELAATVVDRRSEPLEGVRRQGPLALLFGEEGYGLPPHLIEACGRRLTIPLAGGADSLNVAVACGIFLHHFRRG